MSDRTSRRSLDGAQRYSVIERDVVDDVINGLYAVGMHLAALDLVGERAAVIDQLLAELEAVMARLQQSIMRTHGAHADVVIEQVVAAMKYADRGLSRLVLQATPNSPLAGHLVDASHASRWALASMDEAQRDLESARRMNGSADAPR